MNETLRQRALAEALADTDGRFSRIRQEDGALARLVVRAARRERVARPLGIMGLLGGGVLATLTAAAVVATPLGWIAAGAASVTGLLGLGAAGQAGRRREAAARRHKRLRLGHAGRALEVEALLKRVAAVRSAMGRDYARYEERVLARVHPDKYVDNAALLQGLRGRQMEAVARLDTLRDRAVALRDRLVRAAITAEVDGELAGLEPAREVYQDRLARTVFERDDARQELERLGAETDALEVLEAEYAAL